MENQGVPEAWIGQEVVLHTVSDREFLATLVELKDFGFAYRFRDDEDVIFAPWGVLRWMRLASEGDEFYRTQPLFAQHTATSMASQDLQDLRRLVEGEDVEHYEWMND